mgnify:CR=1 FL=1
MQWRKRAALVAAQLVMTTSLFAAIDRVDLHVEGMT